MCDSVAGRMRFAAGARRPLRGIRFNYPTARKPDRVLSFINLQSSTRQLIDSLPTFSPIWNIPVGQSSLLHLLFSFLSFLFCYSRSCFPVMLILFATTNAFVESLASTRSSLRSQSTVNVVPRRWSLFYGNTYLIARLVRSFVCLFGLYKTEVALSVLSPLARAAGAT